MAVVFFRTCILYIAIIFSIRIMGKRQIGELQPSEFVITILISNIATLPIEDTDIPLLAGLMPILTLVVFEVFSSAISMKSIIARRIISGSPRVVIRDGVIDQKELLNLRFSIDDLMEQLRLAGIFDLNEVAFAVVETTGNVSIMPKYQHRPLTPNDIGLYGSPKDNFAHSVIISNGKVINSALKACNLNMRWLQNTLKKENIEQNDIFVMTCSKSAEYYIVPKESKKTMKCKQERSR